MFWVLICTFHLTVCSYHVRYAFQSESTLYISLTAKELPARSRHKIWSLSNCYCRRTHNHLVHKRTLNHLAKWLSVCLWTKWLWVRVQLQSLIGACLDRKVCKLINFKKLAHNTKLIYNKHTFWTFETCFLARENHLIHFKISSVNSKI